MKNGVKKTHVKTSVRDGQRAVTKDNMSVDEGREKTEDVTSVEEDVATEKEEDVEGHEDNTNATEETKKEDDGELEENGAVLTLTDLRVVRTALKVVSQCIPISCINNT